jgi:antitoxin component YwqK of YwqJK toxin-antitoxin module
MREIQNTLILLLVFSINLLNAQSDSLWNQSDENNQKIGKWRAYHSNGKLRYEGQFNEGKPFDVFRYYFSNGDLQSVLKYKSDTESYATHYYQNGDLMASGKYVNQKKDSVWISYGEDNVVVEKGGFINGKKYGSWKTFYKSGQVAEEQFLENDLENGPLKIYFEDGSLKQEAIYKDGFLEGLSTFYDPAGNKTLKGKYVKGARDGRWIYYKELLEVEKVLEYDKGRLLNPEVENLIDDSTLKLAEVREVNKAQRTKKQKFCASNVIKNVIKSILCNIITLPIKANNNNNIDSKFRKLPITTLVNIATNKSIEG